MSIYHLQDLGGETCGPCQFSACINICRFYSLFVFSSLKMKPDVVLRHLSIAVAATDQSYMPQQVTVAVGRTAGDLQEVRDVHIPSNVTGYVTLLENANISQLCESTKRHLALLAKRTGGEEGRSCFLAGKSLK